MEKLFKERKRNVAQFLNSYFILQDLIGSKKGEDTDDQRDYTTTVKPVECDPYETELEVGQIRVMPHTERITYVALVRRWEEDSFLVMPFSQFNHPATDEELLTRFDGGMLMRVLQGWNARTLQDKTLQKSWVAATLPKSDVEDACRLWEMMLGGEPLGNTLLKRTGLPIYKSDDPRLDYKREELKNFARIDEEDLALVEREARLADRSAREHPANPFAALARLASSYRTTIWKQPEHALAAATRKKKFVSNFTLEETGDVITIRYSFENRILSADVFDKDGNSTNAIDGYKVCSCERAAVLGVIEKGFLRIELPSSLRDEACNICIVDCNDNPVKGNWREVL